MTTEPEEGRSLSAEQKMEQQNNPDLPTDHLRLPQEAAEVARDSDLESCASVRTQDSLDLLDDVDKTSDMRGSQRDLQSLASPEPEEKQDSEQREGYLEVTIDDCKRRRQELQETNHIGVTVTDCDSHDQEPPGEDNADATVQKMCPLGLSTATAVVHCGQSIAGVGAGDQEPLLHFQEHPEIDTGGPKSEDGQSHDHQLQGMPADEDAGEKGQLADNSLEQASDVSEELPVSTEATPYQVNEPVEMVPGNMCTYVSEEKCPHQTCWKGEIVSQDGVLELEGDAGRSVRYPLQKQTPSTDHNSTVASIELDPGTLAVDVEEETSAVPSNDGVALVGEACPTEEAKGEQLGLSTPINIAEKNGSGVVVLKQDWRVQTVNNGTAFQCDWDNSMLLEPCPMFRIAGAVMV